MLEVLLDGIRTYLLKKENKYIQHAIDELRCMFDYDSARMSQVSQQSSSHHTIPSSDQSGPVLLQRLCSACPPEIGHQTPLDVRPV